MCLGVWHFFKVIVNRGYAESDSSVGAYGQNFLSTVALLVIIILDDYVMFQTLPSMKVRTGDGLGMSPRNVYMSDSMPNRSGSHRGSGVVARPYVDAAPSASAAAAGRSGIPSGCGPIQSGTAPRRRGIFTTLGKGFVSTRRGGRGISSTSAPNLGDIWLSENVARHDWMITPHAFNYGHLRLTSGLLVCVLALHSF